MKFEAHLTRYQIELSIDEFEKVLVKDEKAEEDKELYTLLYDKTKADHIDYDGHYGPYIFLELEKQNDTVKEKTKILKIIKTYIGKD